MHRVVKQERISWFVDLKLESASIQLGWLFTHLAYIHSPHVPISGGQEVSVHVLPRSSKYMLNLSTIYPVRPYLTLVVSRWHLSWLSQQLSSYPFGQVVNVTNGSIIVEFLLRPRAHTDSPLRPGGFEQSHVQRMALLQVRRMAKKGNKSTFIIDHW